jgi:hypothetical protein
MNYEQRRKFKAQQPELRRKIALSIQYDQIQKNAPPPVQPEEVEPDDENRGETLPARSKSPF